MDKLRTLEVKVGRSTKKLKEVLDLLGTVTEKVTAEMKENGISIPKNHQFLDITEEPIKSKVKPKRVNGYSPDRKSPFHKKKNRREPSCPKTKKD